jgi:D-psicose/D-tagatose/L-ribulose 3-epimerase
MKYGINTFLWTASFNESNLDLLPRIKAMGFDGVELARFSFDDCPTAPIRRALEENALECTFCTALTGRLSLANEQAPAALTFLRDAIHWAAEVGAKTVAGPFCSAVGYLPGRRRTEDEWQRAIEGLRSLTPVLEETGVALAVEPLNRFETFFLNTGADAAALCDAVNHPQVGVLFDTFHANIEERSIRSALVKIGRHLKHVHTCENDRGTPGSGHVAWPELFDSLGRLHYDGWLVIESFGSRVPEIATAACIWRDLAVSPEALAEDGLKFLKRSQARAAEV